MSRYKFLLLVMVLLFNACAVSMKKTLPGVRVDPEAVAARIERAAGLLKTDKQIFKVRLLDKGRTFSGDGALFYRSPDTLQLSIYGPPFTTLWMQMLSRGDSIVVVLPKDNKVIRASRKDPQPLTKMAGSEGLSDAQFMGAVTGVFQLESFRGPGTVATAATADGISTLRLSEGATVYQFQFIDSLEAVLSFVHYRDGKKCREVTRADFRTVDSLTRARKTIYRDYIQDREITVMVSKEQVNPELADEAFQLLLP